jgi:hypothetical protein
LGNYLITAEFDQLIGFDTVFGDPHGVAEHLVSAKCIFGLIGIEVRVASDRMVVLWLTLEPWTPMAERGYPTERVSITIWSDERIWAVPLDPNGRGWRHYKLHNSDQGNEFKELCLWSPFDPSALRWEWADGLVKYVTIVHRHIQAEEYFRRYPVWPSEEAPHGLGEHPIQTFAISRIVHEGKSQC